MTAPTDAASPPSDAGSRGSPWILLALAGAIFGVAIAVLGGLGFALHKDEYWFWRQTLVFANEWPPSLAELRSYREPMTPLSFLVWAALERATGAGVALARLTNIALCVSMLLLIGGRRPDPGRRGLLAACGFLLFPYVVPLSVYLYTDVPAAFFSLLGFWLYARRRPVASALAFVLAIATRQYMVVFPLALAAAELAPALLGRGAWRLERSLPQLAAAASLGGWYLFFGGFGPQAGLEDWPRHTDALSQLVPAYGLYSLACIGAYLVVPEFLLYRRWRGRTLGELLSPRSAAFAAALLLLFALFPPTAEAVTMGALNRATLLLLPPESTGLVGEGLRNTLFAGLAWLACLRFLRVDLAGWMLLGHALLMVASFEGWEKYNLPVLAVLWYLVSFFDAGERIDLWNARD